MMWYCIRPCFIHFLDITIVELFVYLSFWPQTITGPHAPFGNQSSNAEVAKSGGNRRPHTQQHLYGQVLWEYCQTLLRLPPTDQNKQRGLGYLVTLNLT